MKKKKMNDLERFLCDLEALFEILFAMVVYYEKMVDNGDDVGPETVIQTFRFVWECSEKMFNKHYAMLHELSKELGS